MNLFSRRIRGFRLIEVIGLGLLIATVLTVYLGKTLAGKERNQIASVEKQIAEERNRVRLLQAEVSYLEQPERLERLATNYLGLQPISAKREASIEALASLASLAGSPLPGAPTALAAAPGAAPVAPGTLLPTAPVAAAMAVVEPPPAPTVVAAVAEKETLKASVPAPARSDKRPKGEVTP